MPWVPICSQKFENPVKKSGLKTRFYKIYLKIRCFTPFLATIYFLGHCLNGLNFPRCCFSVDQMCSWAPNGLILSASSSVFLIIIFQEKLPKKIRDWKHIVSRVQTSNGFWGFVAKMTSDNRRSDVWELAFIGFYCAFDCLKSLSCDGV